ncbi:hypothetical protein ABZN20_15680 [Methylococcus sp. ANG]|jgi:hypothetical protein|uniref:hypothetical protein n=1 Tax=Methylococcus sp. ANG TaxID=3231903 RepID=UPI00345A438A
MSYETGIKRGDRQQRLSGLGFIGGAILIVVGSLLLPRAPNLGDIQAMQKAYAEQAALLQACALLLAFGFWALLIGTAGVYHSITTDGAAWARLGFYFHLVGAALWTIGMSLDISYPAAILNWLAASESNREVAYSVVTVLSPLGFGRGTFPLNIIVNWLAFTFFSIAVLRSFTYPRWIGWYGLFLGIAGLALGIIMTFTGREAVINPFVIFMFLNLVWWFAWGIWIIRKAW